MNSRPSRPPTASAGPGDDPAPEEAPAGDRTRRSDPYAHVIGFGEFQRHFGDDWARLSKRASLIAEGILRNRLNSGEYFTGFKDLGVMVRIPHVPRQDAERRVAAIAAEISSHLVGATEIDASASVATLFRGADGALRIDERPVRDIVGGDGPDAGSTFDAEGWTPIIPSGPDGPGAGNRAGPDGAGPLLEQVAFVYEPVWDVRRKVLSTYRCRPTRTKASGAPVFGYDVIPDHADTDRHAELDLGTLAHVKHELAQLHDADRRVLMVCPIHFRTLIDNADFVDFRMSCQAMTDEQRRDLVFEVQGLQDVGGA